MTFSRRRVAAITVKELQDYRHNRFVIATMAFLPILFIALPIVQLLITPAVEASSKLDARVGLSLLYMLLIPAFVPSTLAAYSVVGEREQGTLEPVLITPIRREEFLVGKALAVAIPTLTIAYAIFGIFLVVAKLFAHAGIDSAIFAGTHILVQLLFTPLLAGWSIWVGIAISARSSDIRAAQQLSIFASLPAARDHRPDAVQGDHAVDRPRTRSRRSPADRRRARVAGGGGDLRPRTPHHRQTRITVAARLAAAAEYPQITPFRTGADQQCPQR